VLQASYSGVFVDEYQDCSGNQHAMIVALAELLPCRVVGDPLQAIYGTLHGDDPASWAAVESCFPAIVAPAEPYRWRVMNPPLGEWLVEVRRQLISGDAVDLRDAAGIVEWTGAADIESQIRTLYRAADKSNVVAICDWPDRCADVASRTRNLYAVLESVECPDLLEAAERIESKIGVERVAAVVDLAERCLTRVSHLSEMLARLRGGASYSPRVLDRQRLWDAMQAVASSSDLREVEVLMTAIFVLVGIHYYRRRELWQEMTQALRRHDGDSGKRLRDTAWLLRDSARRNGRRITSRRTVATALLIKGLEFDHALLLDATQMRTAEELYVALTRASQSLIVLSPSPVLGHALPAWLRVAPLAM
jgi:DNA helicase-2/ATP-dependent DNA helicase PcrA